LTIEKIIKQTNELIKLTKSFIVLGIKKVDSTRDILENKIKNETEYMFDRKSSKSSSFQRKKKKEENMKKLNKIRDLKKDEELCDLEIKKYKNYFLEGVLTEKEFEIKEEIILAEKSKILNEIYTIENDKKDEKKRIQEVNGELNEKTNEKDDKKINQEINQEINEEKKEENEEEKKEEKNNEEEKDTIEEVESKIYEYKIGENQLKDYKILCIVENNQFGYLNINEIFELGLLYGFSSKLLNLIKDDYYLDIIIISLKSIINLNDVIKKVKEVLSELFIKFENEKNYLIKNLLIFLKRFIKTYYYLFYKGIF
jgi:hypothetical protein